jgi:N-acetylmuramoyl-L-alanine amidase
MKNINKSGERTASWHFTVDFDEIYQAQSTNYKCYHAGNGIGNNTSIGIEMCMYSDKEKQRQVYLNAIELVKILLKYYGWGVDKVKRHYDWTRKHCPAYLIEGRYGYTWNWFKGQCSKAQTIEQNESKNETKIPNGDYNKYYEIKSTDGKLVVRDARPKDGKLGNELGELKNGDKVLIGYVLNNWGGIIFNGKQGFVNMEYLVEVKEVKNDFKPYLVRCKVDNLKCRKGAGIDYPIERTINTGDVITIVEEKMNGNTKWGLAKSGYWVALKYTTFVRFI